ncbi:Unknown protein, partial [Striga hermonthica]
QSFIGQDEDLTQRLEVFSLSETENVIIDIAKIDIRYSAEECHKSLFGKIIGDRPVSWMGVKRTMSYIWKLRQPMEVKELAPNFFQFIFQSKEDLERVARGTNWTIDNQFLLLSEWKERLSANHPVFQELPIWVQVYNVPLNWLSTEVGYKIGRVFHRLKNVVVAGAGNHGGKILRLLVTINLAESLPRCATIRLGEEIVKVSFKYEKLVNMCNYCGLIGHLDRSCQRKINDIANSSLRMGQYGDWMKTPEFNQWASTSTSSSQFQSSDSPATPVQASSPPNTSTSQLRESNQFPSADKGTQKSIPQEVQNSTGSKAPPREIILASSSVVPIPLPDEHPTQITMAHHILETFSLVPTQPCSNPGGPQEILMIENSPSKPKTWKRAARKDGRLTRQND